MKKKLKQLLLFMMAVVMMLSSVSLTAFADETDTDEQIPPVFYKDDDNRRLRVVVGSTEELSIGKTSTLSVTLKNTSGVDWEKTYVQIAPEEYYREYYGDIDEDELEEGSGILQSMNTTYPFEVIDSLNERKNIGSIKAGNKKTTNLRVSVKKNLSQDYYPVLLLVSTEDENGHIREYEKTIMVWAEVKDGMGSSGDEDSKEAVAFALGENQSTPHGVYGNVMNFNINMRNIGYKTAYDVRVEMELSEHVDSFPFEINDGNYDRWMGNMEANQTVEVPYSMAIREDARSGYYPIHYTIKYREQENGSFMTPVDEVMYVRIVGKDGEDKLSADAGENERTKARIIVDSFETEPETILAGQEFTLKVTMKNASNTIAASNILFTLDPEEVEYSPVFTTVNGSNSVVVNSLAPGQSEVLTLHYISSPSLEQRSYTITVVEQYDSPEFKNARETVKFALPIRQEARLKTGNIEIMPNSIDVGGETNIMFDINNTGKVDLYNTTVIFEDDTIQRSETYLGNIKPGESGSVDAMVYGIAPTMDDGTVKMIIQYEDERGEVYSVEKEIQLFVSEPMPMDDMFMDFGPMEEIAPEPTMADKLKQYALPAGAAAVLLLGGIVFIIRRKKKKAGMDDEIL